MGIRDKIDFTHRVGRSRRKFADNFILELFDRRDCVINIGFYATRGHIILGACSRSSIHRLVLNVSETNVTLCETLFERKCF